MEQLLPGQEPSEETVAKWNQAISRLFRDNKIRYQNIFKLFLQNTEKTIKQGLPGRVLLCRGVEELTKYEIPPKRVDIACDDPIPDKIPVKGCNYLVRKNNDMFMTWFSSIIGKAYNSIFIGWELYFEKMQNKKIITIINPLSLNDVIFAVTTILDTNKKKGGQLPFMNICVCYDADDSGEATDLIKCFRTNSYKIETMHTNQLIPQYKNEFVLRKPVRCDLYYISKIK